jgi:Zn-dependent membrane protease YugP
MLHILAQLSSEPSFYGQGYRSSGFLGGYGMYIILMLPALLLGLWAQFRIKSAYAAASRVPASSGITGAEAAQMIIDSHNLTGVRVEATQGMLSDHYDPSHKVLRLSPDVYSGRSVAALGIAAHEAGHALQDATGYAPLRLRNGIVPLAQVGGVISNTVLGFGLFIALAVSPMLGKTMLLIGIAGLTLIVLFQLINLPCEYNASRRAKDLLYSSNIVAQGAEATAMNRVLNAAALTYVAGAVGSILTLLYYVMLYMSASRRSN